MKFNLFFVLFTFLAHRFLPKHDIRMQLLMFLIKMLRDRIEDHRIVPTPEERAELLRLGNEINHDVADVMLVVKSQTYRRWLSPKAKTRLARLLPHPAAPPRHGQQRHLCRFPAQARRQDQAGGAARRHRRLVRAGSGVDTVSFNIGKHIPPRESNY